MTNRPSSLAAELSRNGSSNIGGRVKNDSAAKQLGSTQDISNSNDDNSKVHHNKMMVTNHLAVIIIRQQSKIKDVIITIKEETIIS